MNGKVKGLSFNFYVVAYTKIVVDALSRIQRGERYPPVHEQKVSLTFEKAVIASVIGRRSTSPRPLRILEVGIGTSCRSINRGLYDATFTALEKYIPLTFTGVDFVGLDAESPNSHVVESVNRIVSTQPFPVNFTFVQGDVSNMKMQFSEGYFFVRILL